MGKHKSTFKNDEVEVISSKLKFIGKLQPGQKINVTSQSIQDNTYWTSMSRSFSGENRNRAYKFISDTIQDSLSVLDSLSNSGNEYEIQICRNLIVDLICLKPGLDNLQNTYQLDKMYVSKVQTLMENLDVKIHEICDKRDELNFEDLFEDAQEKLLCQNQFSEANEANEANEAYETNEAAKEVAESEDNGDENANEEDNEVETHQLESDRVSDVNQSERTDEKEQSDECREQKKKDLNEIVGVNTEENVKIQDRDSCKVSTSSTYCDVAKHGLENRENPTDIKIDIGTGVTTTMCRGTGENIEKNSECEYGSCLADVYQYGNSKTCNFDENMNNVKTYHDQPYFEPYDCKVKTPINKDIASYLKTLPSEDLLLMSTNKDGGNTNANAGNNKSSETSNQNKRNGRKKRKKHSYQYDTYYMSPPDDVTLCNSDIEKGIIR